MAAISFSVGAIFEIEDRASPVLGALSERFGALQGQIDTLQERLAALGREGLGQLEAGLGRVVKGFEDVVTNARTASDAIVRAMNAAGDTATRTAAEINGVAEALANVTRAAAASSTGYRGGGGAEEPEVPRGALSLTSPAAEGAMLGAAASAGAGFSGGGPAPPDAGRFYQAWQRDEQLRIGGPPRLPPEDLGNIPYGRFPAGGDEPYNQSRRGHMGHMAPLIEAGAVYEAMKAAASEEQSIDITLLRGFGIDPRSATQQQRGYLQNLARQGAVGTSFSEAQVAAGEATLAAPLGFRGEEGMKQFGGVFETVTKMAEAAKQLHFGTYEGTLTGMVEFAHQLQMYDAPGLTRAGNLLGAITESLPQGDMAREALVMGYAIPQARALGADPSDAMEGIGFLQRAGLRNTVAATTYRQFLVGMLREGGPMTAHLTHDDKSFRDALMLREDPAHGVHGKGNLHDQALVNLGLIDRTTHKLTVENEHGGIDVAKAFAKMQEASTRLSPVEFGRALYGGFGVRGENVGLIAEAMTPDPKTGVSLFQNYMNTVKGTAPLDEQLKMINITTSQQTGQAVARTADLGNAIGNTLLPTLQKFDAAIIASTNFLRGLVQAHPDATSALVGGGIAATVVGGLMGLRHAAGGLFRGMMGYGAPDAAGGVIRGAVTGGLGAAARGTAIGAAGWGVYEGMSALEGAEDWLEAKVFGQKSVDYRKKTEGRWSDRLWSLFSNPAQAAEAANGANQVTPRSQAPDRQAAAAPPAPTTVNQTITINVTGVPDEAGYKGIISRITSELRSALSTATGTAQGVHESPYMYGSGP